MREEEEFKSVEAHLREYSDTVEALPLELQRNYTLIRQLDKHAEELMAQVATEAKGLSSKNMASLGTEERRTKLERIGQLLNEVLKKGEEKFALAKSTYDTVDRHCTKLDNDLQKIEDEQLIGSGRTQNGSSPHKKSKSSIINNTSVDKKKRGLEIQKSMTGRGRKKSRKDDDDDDNDSDTYLSTKDAIHNAKNAVSLSDLPIDPNEPKYCYCGQVSFGDMVACDNEACDIEWFHYECVGLIDRPKGKWYCKNCTNELKKKKRI